MPSEPARPDLALPPPAPQRLAYLGTPATAVAPLAALHDAGFEIAIVITGADKRRGRRAEPTPTPVKAAAIAMGLPVSHDPADAERSGADLGVVVAFGQIIRRPLLEVLPMVNLHFSLLPRWRGAAPVERAILAGDERTGVCVMAVEEGLDTGGVYASEVVDISATATADRLAATLTTVGARLLVDSLRTGLGQPTAQSGQATYAAKLSTEDLHLDWARPAVELDRVVRVGGAWTTFRGRRLKVHSATLETEGSASGEPGALHHDLVTTGSGVLQLVEVQPEGKARIGFHEWANGARPDTGERLGWEDDPS